MAFNPTNPVEVGLATKVDHYDRVFNNTLLLKTSIEDDGSLIAGLLLRTPEIRAYKETVVVAAIAAGTLTLDLSAGNWFYVPLNANIVTFVITNAPANGMGASFRIWFVADGTPRTVDFGADVAFASGAAYVPTSTNGRLDELTFSKRVGTTKFLGAVTGQNWTP